MAKTRQPATADIHVCVLGERPRIFIDCGCWAGSFWFDDCVELRAYLTHAIRNDNLPEWAAQQSLDSARSAIGDYEEGGSNHGRDRNGRAEHLDDARSTEAPGRSSYCPLRDNGVTYFVIAACIVLAGIGAASVLYWAWDVASSLWRLWKNT